MKKTNLLFILLLSFVSINAQLGSIINKAKDKVNKKANAVVNGNSAGKSFSNIEGASLIFSSTPFKDLSSSGGETEFRSDQFIYGQLRLANGTIRDVFKIRPKNNDNPHLHFNYETEVWRDGQKIWENVVWVNCLIRDDEVDKSYFNFDVLPEPSVARTIISSSEDFSSGKGPAMLYAFITPSVFSSEGNYRIRLGFSNAGLDAWGNLLPENKWPQIESSFSFAFSNNDIGTLTSNGKKAKDIINEAAATKPVPAEWRLKSNPINTGYSQQQIQNAFLDNFRARNPKILKFYADDDSGESIYKDTQDGSITGKRYRQRYIIFAKDNQGKCFSAVGAIWNDYAGWGTYTKTMKCSYSDIAYYPCDQLK